LTASVNNVKVTEGAGMKFQFTQLATGPGVRTQY